MILRSLPVFFVSGKGDSTDALSRAERECESGPWFWLWPRLFRRTQQLVTTVQPCFGQWEGERRLDFGTGNGESVFGQDTGCVAIS